ncbi:MAG: hypothetical protein U1F20_04715 [Lysobacterales bacterium]
MNIADRYCCIGRGLAALNGKGGFDDYLYRVMADFKQVFDRRSSEGTTVRLDYQGRLVWPNRIDPGCTCLAGSRQHGEWLDRMAALRDKENRELTQLRDWLLPC